MLKNSYKTVNNFDDLKAQCERLGLFERTLFSNAVELTLIALSFLISVFLREMAPVLAFAFASVAGITLLWWIHDSGHDSTFKSRKTSQIWIEGLGLFFMGMPQIEYHYEVHRFHHAFTNIIGKDGALDTKPIIWNRKQMTNANRKFYGWQSVVWFFIVLPLVWPLINFRSVQTLWKRKEFLRLFIFTARWVVVPWLLDFDWVFILGPTLISGFVLGYVGSLNHFHMPMDDKKLSLHPKNIFLTTQNLSHRGWLATWLTGGLNFHIEHHLFPTMPSRNLKYAAPLVQAFARDQGFPYHVCSLTEATQKLHRQLANPFFLHEVKP